MPNIVSEISQRLLALPEGSNQVLEGATEDEIRELEDFAGGRLPLTYKDFLTQLGRSAGELFRGTEYSVIQRFRLRLREHAERILARSKAPFTLPRTAFVFLLSPGSQFSFFNRDQGDDPSVYHYREGYQTPKQLNSTLSDYLLRCVEECEQRAYAANPVEH